MLKSRTVFCKMEELCLSGSYKNDYNLSKLDGLIKLEFERRSREIPRLESLISDLKSEKCVTKGKVKNFSLSTKITSLEKKLKLYKEKLYEEYYNLHCSPLVKIYGKLGILGSKKNFLGAIVQKNKSEDKDKTERLKVIENYLKLVSKICNVKIRRNYGEILGCPYCSSEWSKKLNYGVEICSGCGFTSEKLCLSSYCNYTIPSGGKSNYVDKSNFIKGLLRFQGKQTKDLPDSDCLNKIIKHFESVGLDSAEAKRKPIDKWGRKPGTSHEMLCDTLSDLKLSGHFGNVNYIGKTIWGWELENLNGALKEQILRDYDASQGFYREMVSDDKSSPNVQFRLFKQLSVYSKKLRFPLRSSDFRIPEGSDSSMKEIWAKIEINMGWVEKTNESRIIIF